MTKAEADKLNRRRVELIHKKYAGGLTVDETVELADVNERFGAWVKAKCPRDTAVLEGFNAYVQQLRAKINAQKAKPDPQLN